MNLTRPLILVLLLAAAGCAKNYDDIPNYTPSTQPLTDTGLSSPQAVEAVDALAAPPTGWKIEPQKGSDKHAHQVWLSPTGRTAYGIIHFGIPLPMPATWILGPWLDEMKKSEGEATLIGTPLKDDQLPGVRFVVEGGEYKMRVNLICKGFKGWAVYAGTLRKEPEMPAELELAERAREKTVVAPSNRASQSPPTFAPPTASASE